MLADVTRAPRGRLRIGAPTIGYRFLMPLLPEFRRCYPDIELDIDFNDRLVDVVEEGLDAVIRSGVLRDSSLVARTLGPFRFVLCASPAYLEEYGTPQVPSDLQSHDCLRFRFPTSGKLQAWQLTDAQGVDPFGRPSPLTCNNMEALRGAAIAGLGIAYMPDFLACSAFADGTLTEILGHHLVDPGQFSILWPSNRHLSPRLRVFVDFIVDRLFKAEANVA